MTEKYIFRRKREEDWTVLPNDMLQDSDLSWEARGLLCYLLSKPEDWTVRKKDLENQSPAGQYAVKTILQELQDNRYVRRKKTRNEKGQYEWVTWVFDEPYPEEYKTTPDSTMDGSSSDGSAGDIQNTEEQNTNTTEPQTHQEWIDYLNEGSAYSTSKPPKKETTTITGNYDLSWLEEPLHEYATAFIEVFDREPVSSKEKKAWANCFREWMSLGVVPSQVGKMYKHAREQDLSIKSPYSITFAYDDIRGADTTEPDPYYQEAK